MYYNIIINNEIFEVIEWWKDDTERIEVVQSPGWFTTKEKLKKIS